MFQNVPEKIIRKALRMYILKNTQYLKKAQIDKNGDTINLIANFSISDCCYAPDSGHFNAVEAIICLNQTVYVALLGGIEKNMFPFYDGFTSDEFCQHWQEVYISVFEKIKFKKFIQSFSFWGRITLKPVHRIGNKIYVYCCFGFGNDEECTNFIGDAKGFIPLLDSWAK